MVGNHKAVQNVLMHRQVLVYDSGLGNELDHDHLVSQLVPLKYKQLNKQKKK